MVKCQISGNSIITIIIFFNVLKHSCTVNTIALLYFIKALHLYHSVGGKTHQGLKSNSFKLFLNYFFFSCWRAPQVYFPCPHQQYSMHSVSEWTKKTWSAVSVSKSESTDVVKTCTLACTHARTHRALDWNFSAVLAATAAKANVFVLCWREFLPRGHHDDRRSKGTDASQATHFPSSTCNQVARKLPGSKAGGIPWVLQHTGTGPDLVSQGF